MPEEQMTAEECREHVMTLMRIGIRSILSTPKVSFRREEERYEQALQWLKGKIG